jgi:uncharacterized protein (TIGR00251 family)
MADARSGKGASKKDVVRGVDVPGELFVLLPVKVVPGSRREEIVGWLGDRLKVKVAAPPEDGRANEALCRLIASSLGVRGVEVVSGHSRAEKVVRITGVTAAALASRLGSADV